MTTERKIFKLHYVGARFRQRRLPLDVLMDLPAFRDLIVSYVEAEWRAAHKTRKRLPKGFDQSLAFTLVDIGDGSAVPILEWDLDAAQPELPEFKDVMESYVERSFARAMALIDGADVQSAIIRQSPATGSALARLGLGLRDDERIEFVESRGTDGKVVFLDQRRRRSLISRRSDTHQTRFDSVGKLLGCRIDPEETDGSIIVSTEEHGEIRIPAAPERVRAYFGNNIGADVQFRLLILLDSSNTFRNIIEVFEVDVIDETIAANLERCRARVDALCALEGGWHDGGAVAITDEATSAVSRLLSARPHLAGSFRIYPTETGGFLLELVHRGWDYGIEIGPTGSVEIYGVRVDGPDEVYNETFGAIDDVFFERFDTLTGEHQSAAVYGVSVGEFRTEKIPCHPDPVEAIQTRAANLAHAYADYSAFNSNQAKRAAQRIRNKAVARGVLYSAD